MLLKEAIFPAAEMIKRLNTSTSLDAKTQLLGWRSLRKEQEALS